ncbi:hypothetical protein ASC94_10290 [Massilia sp. Root418]|uniref:hypothetical protein n=1 Tax=Massilia sp. Root418 TaxID=1736532 RepID=UPI00070081BC|nr:hypothetical protein [Massilia sp. Root418]KQW97168.1 hypothetical protein ASC94_10290 [Massilia sp. Root418]
MHTQQPQRSNQILARHVDEGLTIDSRIGAANAWAYMLHKAVPAGVITRVLAYPEQRRRG